MGRPLFGEILVMTPGTWATFRVDVGRGFQVLFDLIELVLRRVRRRILLHLQCPKIARGQDHG